MTIEKPSPTESFVHQMLGTLVTHKVITDDLRNQISRDAANSSLAERVEASAGKASDLNDAVARLKAFRSTRNPGDVIDEETSLTAADIDTILSFVTDFPSSD